MKWNKQYEYIMTRQTKYRQRMIYKELQKYGLDPSKSSRNHEKIIYKYVNLKRIKYEKVII